MKCWVYILQSQSTGRYYCGHTNNLERRIQEHNNPDYKLSRTTKVFRGPWNLIWKELLSDRGEAMILEKAIKKRGIGKAEVPPNGGIRVRAGEPKINPVVSGKILNPEFI